MFRLHERLYGITRTQPYELAQSNKIVPIRGVPDFIRGAMIWKNSVVPVVDLKRCLNIPDDTSSVRESIIIFQSYENGEMLELGILVDSLQAEVTISAHDIIPLTAPREEGVLGTIETEKGVATLVDLKSLLLHQWYNQ